MVHQEIGGNKKRVKHQENLLVKIGGEEMNVGGEIIEGNRVVQNDDTALITRSTSSSLNNGKTGIETISLHKRSVNGSVPSFPCG